MLEEVVAAAPWSVKSAGAGKLTTVKLVGYGSSMPPAVPSCAYARIGLKPHSLDVQAVLLRIPGVRLQKGIYIVPHHALEPFDGVLQGHNVGIHTAAWASPPPDSWPWEAVKKILLEGAEVRPEFLEDGYLMAYQKEALSVGAARRGVHYWHPTGAGKTCSAILWSLLVPGTVVVITRAAARFQYAREWEKYTSCRPYVIRPASTMKKKAETLDQYLKNEQGRHVIVAAWESLQLYVDRLIALQPSAVIWDEAHLGKSSKRYESIPLPELPEDPTEAVKLAAAQDGEARSRGGFISDKDGARVMIIPLDNTAMAAAKLARAAWRRCATTATPVKDRVRDLWAQLDIVEPDAWGSATSWLDRYADRKPGLYGGYDTTGTSNLPELTDRLAKVTHHIAYATTHRQLPPKRRQSVYVGAEDQAPPSAGFAKELKDAQRRGATAVLEVKLAEAASRKRKAVLGLIEDHVYGGGKVVLFTGRRKDVDVLGDLIRKSDAVKAKGASVWAAHGENSSEERSDIVLDYMAHPGPCVLVGTGDSFGESLNMQDTDAAMFVMLPYTPGQIRQWEGRFCRLGQKRPVTIYYVIAEGSVDEHVADILIRKLPAVEQVAKDEELAAAKDVIAGFDSTENNEEFANKLLGKIARAEAETAAEDEVEEDWE
jgi:superfamily II DNA or RNA helicase